MCNFSHSVMVSCPLGKRKDNEWQQMARSGLTVLSQFSPCIALGLKLFVHVFCSRHHREVLFRVVFRENLHLVSCKVVFTS